MARSLALLILGLLCCAEPCSAAFIAFGGHWYGLTSGPQTWTAAELEAVGLGGHLVAVNSAAEQSFLETAFLAFPNQNQVLWIGLSDASNEGVFTWSNGDPVTYTNWRGGEPNNALFDSQGEDYAALNWGFQSGLHPFGTWNDTPLAGTPPGFAGTADYGPYRGIIELTFNPDAISSVPEPVSLLAWCGCGLLGLVVGIRRRKR